MAKHEQDKAKEKEGLEYLLEKTEDAYYYTTQKRKWRQDGNTEARDKAFLIAKNYYQKNPQTSVGESVRRCYSELYGEEEDRQKVGLNALAEQHEFSLYQYTVSEIIEKIVANSGFSKEKIEELAPSIKQYYDKQLGDLIKDKKDEKAKKDFIAIMQLYNESLEAKKAKELYQLRMGNFLESYYKQDKEQEKEQEE